MTFNELEQHIGQALQQAGQELMLQACKAMEAQMLDREEARYRRDKRRPLYLLTRFGWIRLRRWQACGKEGGGYRPLDGMLGLESHQQASPWIIEQPVVLATRLPYR